MAPKLNKRQKRESVSLEWSVSRTGTLFQDVGRVRLIQCDEVPGWFVFSIDVPGEPRWARVTGPRDIATRIPLRVRRQLTIPEKTFLRLLRLKYGHDLEGSA